MNVTSVTSQGMLEMFMRSVCESLETRQMLSANAVLAKGNLLIHGAPMADNTIVVSKSADGATLDVSVEWTTAKGTEKSFTASFKNTSKIKRVVIDSGKGDDSITVDQTNGSFTVPAFVFAGAGNDTITTGDGNDNVEAGAGNDVISVGGGNDFVAGRHGDDSISGGAGNDTLMGGVGNDTIDGGEGDDRIGGILGTNVLTGSAGRDRFLLATIDASASITDYLASEDSILIVANGKGDLP